MKEITRRSFLKGVGGAAMGAAAVRLLGAGVFASSGELPEPPPDPSTVEVFHPEPVTVEIPEGAYYIAFAGDQHSETPGFLGWIDDVKLVYGDRFRYIGFAGDICNQEWEQPVFDEFRTGLEARMPGAFCVTTGNKEYAAGAPKWETLGNGFLRLGEAVRTEDYAVYHLGAAQANQVFPETDIAALKAYLDTSPKDIPIFILSHYPLHLAMATAAHPIPNGDHRQTENNDRLIAVLNEHPNVIFLWGHNHTFMDARYGTIRPAGSKISWSYEDPKNKAALNFTYANYGAFCRSMTYGLFAELLRREDGLHVRLFYIDTNVPMEDKEQAELVFGPEGTVEAEVTPGSGIDMQEMLLMTGFPEDPHFLEEY